MHIYIYIYMIYVYTDLMGLRRCKTDVKIGCEKALGGLASRVSPCWGPENFWCGAASGLDAMVEVPLMRHPAAF